MAYSKTTWVDGQTVVDASKLNNIESGIESLDQKLDGHGTTRSMAPSVSGATVKTSAGDVNELVVTSTSGKAFRVGSVSLSAGVWIINFGMTYVANASGARIVTCIPNSAYASVRDSAQEPPVNGGTTRLFQSKVVSLTEATTYYLYGYQNSGSALDASPFFNAVKL